MILAGATISTALIKAYIDFRRWPFENHWIGFLAAALIICLLMWKHGEIYPMFLFNAIFNPALNTMKGLPFFYIGSTSIIDKELTLLFDRYAGQWWFYSNIVFMITSIIILDL